MGEPRVNVLELDLALDEMYPLTDPRQNDTQGGQNIDPIFKFSRNDAGKGGSLSKRVTGEVSKFCLI